MHALMIVAVLAAGAVTGYRNFCLKAGSVQDRAYDFMTQCEAAKRAIANSAENSPTQIIDGASAKYPK